MMLNMYEYALSLSWTQAPEQSRAMNLINPLWILVKVVNISIEIDESH